VKRLALALVLFAAAPALADAVARPGECVEADGGCGGCGQEVCSPPLGPDMSIGRDLSTSPRDLRSPPSDGALDARRQRVRRRNRAHGRGLVLLSGLSALAIVALRRRYRTTRPTPAESALAASDTRSDS
jgi:hypothetical protein